MLHQILVVRVIMFLLMMVEVVLVLVPATYPPKKTIFAETGNIGGFRYLIMSAQHLPWFC